MPFYSTYLLLVLIMSYFYCVFFYLFYMKYIKREFKLD